VVVRDLIYSFINIFKKMHSSREEMQNRNYIYAPVKICTRFIPKVLGMTMWNAISHVYVDVHGMADNWYYNLCIAVYCILDSFGDIL
jgi:hypothetical protein